MSLVPAATPEASPHAPRALGALLRVLATGVLAGLLLAAADALRLHLTYAPNLALGADRWVWSFGAVAVLTLAGTLAGATVALVGALARGCAVRLRGNLRPVGAAVVGAAPLVAVVVLLNRIVLDKAPLAGIALVAGTAVVGVGALLAIAPLPSAVGPAARWGRRLAAVLVTAGALQADATLYVGLYPDQHRTLALAAVLGALALARELRGHRSRPRLDLAVVGAAALTWAGLFALAPGDLSQNVRFLSYEAAPMEGHALRLLAPLADFDRDGSPALLGGGDCDDLDPAVRPGAPEQPDNGRDDDCLGGDLDAAARAAYEARTAAPTRTPPPLPPAARHLLVVSVDALRYDRFAPSPGAPVRVPRLRAAAERGVVFDRMYVPYPSTILSLYGIMASVYPSEVRLAPYHQFEVPSADPHATLAEVLRAAGFATGGFWFHHIFAPELGIGRGFDTAWVAANTPDVVNGTVSATETTDRALAWVDAHPSERLFLWVHYYDPHEPYNTPPGAAPAGTDEARYDAEVAHADAQLGRLLDGLAARGLLADAALWLFADHGEEFGDHGGQFHATSLYDELLRVPAALVAPGLGARHEPRPLSLVDLAPTSLELLGLGAVMPDSFRGRTLLPLLLARPTPARPVFAECFRKDGEVLRGVIDGPAKLVYARDAQFFELYFLDHDPLESRNVFDLLPRQAATLERLLGAFVGAELAETE